MQERRRNVVSVVKRKGERDRESWYKGGWGELKRKGERRRVYKSWRVKWKSIAWEGVEQKGYKKERQGEGEKEKGNEFEKGSGIVR